MIKILSVYQTFITLCLIVATGVGAALDQQAGAPAAGAALTVTGEVPRPLNLSLADLAKKPRHSVTAKDHDGNEGKYEGVLLGEILREAGVKSGKELRGGAVALYLFVEAADGYKAVFALPELDPAFTDRITLLADKRDGKPLAERDGPLQIIIPDEKRHARWVRQVKALTVRRAN